MKCEIYTDGASRGNPGRAAWAYLILSGGRVLCSDSGYLGRATNNVAEYTAVLKALSRAHQLGCRQVVVYSDSQLVVRQLRGEYAVRKKHLRELHARVLKLADRFESLSFSHTRRSNRYVEECDRMCNAVLG